MSQLDYLNENKEYDGRNPFELLKHEVGVGPVYDFWESYYLNRID